MGLSSDEMNAIKFRELGGEKAAEAWNAALNALHAYAQESKARPGQDVVAWFDLKMRAYQVALSDAIQASSARARALPND